MSSEDNGTKWLYGIGGAVIGGVVGYLLDHHEGDDDEDRPPILVKDGSLYFISGDDAAGESGEKQGKPWKDKDDDWQPDHPAGKATKWFVVEISPPASGCPAISMTKKITITYGMHKFVVEAKPEFGGKGKKVPTITSPYLKRDGSADNPALVHDKGSSGKISKVEFKTKDGEDVSCSPASLNFLRIWQF